MQRKWPNPILIASIFLPFVFLYTRCIGFYFNVKNVNIKISWLTKQGYTAEEIDEVIASEVIQDEAKETATESEKDIDNEKEGDYITQRIKNIFVNNITCILKFCIWNYVFLNFYYQ